jgi:hypothetical protein
MLYEIPARITALVALCLAASACAPSAVTVRESHSDSGASLSGTTRMTGYVESARVTDFCPDQSTRPADERCIVTRGWDYSRGVTIVRTFDPQGKLIDVFEPEGADLSLTPAEQARVEALVRADSRTRDIVNQPEVSIWSGGFVHRRPGDPFCDRGSRCIRSIAFTDNGQRVLLHSVVDLMSDRVVYPFYSPAKETAASGK